MADDTISASLVATASDENSSPARLTELAQHMSLHPLLAANPATPTTLLQQLANTSDSLVRRAVALNPNTPVPVLCDLAAEFPEEFLHNPLLPVLNMTQPDFIKWLPLASWASLLRFSDLSPAWFRLIKNEKSYQRVHQESWKLLQLHVSLADEASKNQQPDLANIQELYQHNLPTSRSFTPEENVGLFLRFALLFPFTLAMQKKELPALAPIDPRGIGSALSLLREISAGTAARIIQGHHPFVLSQIARHPATPQRLLKHLALYSRDASNNYAVQCATADNPRTPLEAVYRLTSAPETRLRSKAATHPALDTLDRAILALDEEIVVRASLATSPQLAPDLFVQLAIDPAPTVRAALARNLRIPVDILSTLAQDAEPGVRTAAAGNPRLPVEAQDALLKDQDVSVRASAGGNARLLPAHASVLAQDPSPLVRAHLAANHRTPVALLAILQAAPEPEVWRGLARHPRISPEMLATLARRDDLSTWIAVAAHMRTPVEILTELASKDVRAIWDALANNPCTPLSVLEPVLATPSIDLFYRLVNHPAMRQAKHRPLHRLLATQIQSLIAINCLPGWLRRTFLQYRNALPVEIIAPFAASPHWQERYVLARRPHLPEDLLQKLAQDGICHVQAAARKALAQRQHAQQSRKAQRKH